MPLGDFVGQASHGLFGTIIVEPQGSTYAPINSQTDALDAQALEAYLNPTGMRSRICNKAGDECFTEFVLSVRDGMNLHGSDGSPDGSTAPIDDCPVCDDSYDLGEKGFNYGSEPFWARLSQSGQSPSVSDNLNEYLFPRNFFTEDCGNTGTPLFRAQAGDDVKIRVTHPGGRARQHSFLLPGLYYPDVMSGYGSQASVLMAPGKSMTATLPSVLPGRYIYRDGASHLFAGGVWGFLDVVGPGEKGKAGPSTCAVP